MCDTYSYNTHDGEDLTCTVWRVADGCWGAAEGSKGRPEGGWRTVAPPGMS